ncbi:PfkB family carbohydrate kinase, partial [Streptomyces sp. BE20]|uniref:PfkB family carbohydrate kinase n=1 Tax=Streptomyces sp. BE20 TaxID=3002525 RepID=UPI002E7A39E6
LWTHQQARETLLHLARHDDILIPSADELHILAPDPARDEQHTSAALLAQGTRAVVITRGGDGASVTTGRDGPHHAPAPAEPVEDEIAAGQAYAGGGLSWVLGG